MQATPANPIDISMLTAALGYARRGWHIFPVHSIRNGQCSCGAHQCERAGKHPRTQHGFKDATTDEKKISDWWREWPDANIGLACEKSRLIVIDVDPRNDGDNGFAELVKTHGAIPDTLTSLTGGGGQHYLFYLPDGVDKVKSRVPIQGVEIKSAGSYVILPPSNHLLGRKYEWDSGQPDIPSAAPFWLIDMPRRPGVSEANNRTPVEGVIGAAFIAAGWAGQRLGADKMAVRCPWEHEHTGGSTYDGSTVVFAPQLGSTLGWFHCSHAHCQGRMQRDVLDALPQDAVDRAKGQIRGADKAVAQITPRQPWESSIRYKPGTNEPTSDPGNLQIYLENIEEWKGVLTYDEAKDAITWAKDPPEIVGMHSPELGDALADGHYIYVAHWFALKRGVTFKPHHVQDVLVTAAKARSYNSLVRYIDACEWDGVRRLDTWLTEYCGAVDNAYTRFVGRAWLISAVARALQPGVQVDYALILEGKGGGGKTSFFRILGGEWYLGSLMQVGDKDSRQVLLGSWIVELQELAAMSATEVNRLKAYLTETKDKYRPSYGRNAVERARRCVFGGSTNEGEYIKDPGGARRFWPVRVKDVRTEELTEHRNVLLAEAKARLLAGEKWWPQRGDAIIGALEYAQEERLIVDPWEQAIDEYIRNRSECTTGELLLRLCVEPGKQDPSMARRIGNIMRRRGWERVRTQTPNGLVVWVWRPGVV